MLYPISPDVFWVQGGRGRLFEIEFQGDKIMVTPPPEFEEVVRRLTKDGPEGPGRRVARGTQRVTSDK